MFKRHRQENNKTIHLLKQSRGDFKFDQHAVKNRLLSSIQSQQLSPDRVDDFRFAKIWNTALGTSLSLILVFAGVAAYADNSNPGDKLYFLDQMQEQWAMRMPRSLESKIKLQERMVTERFDELDHLPAEDSTGQTVKLKAAERSYENLIKAVNEASKLKERLNSNSNNRRQSTDNVDKVLSNLEQLAEKQEKRLEEFKKRTSDEDELLKLENNINEIKKARQKARFESGKDQKSNNGDSRDDDDDENRDHDRQEYKGPPEREQD